MKFLRSYAWCCFLAALSAGATASGARPADLRTPGGGTLPIEVAGGDRVRATSSYWRLEFDLRNGGVLGNVQMLSLPGLGDGALATDFDAYEYRLFEIRPAR